MMKNWRKKLISLLLTLVMVVGLMPVGVMTASVKSRSELYNGTWTGTSSFPTSAGHYYLTGNVNCGGKYELNNKGDIHLDLNGYTVTFTGSNTASAIDINSGTNFYLYDTSDAQTGTITRDANRTNYHRLFWMNNASGKFVMYGGTITGFKNSGEEGGAVCVNDGVMYMYGGAITDCQGKNGGAICVKNDKKLYMSGGEIAYCQSTNDGGAVIVRPGGTVEMSGGKIHDNTCNWTGGGIASDGGTVTVSGGEIYNNTANTTSTNNYGGGGIGGWNKANFTVSDTAKIYNNTANLGGGVVLIDGSSLTMTGGEIYDNTATINYPGIGKSNGDSYKVTVSGSGKLGGDSVPFTAPSGTSTVSFDQNGGVGGQTATVAATWGNAMLAVAVPTKDGAGFLGYFDKDGTKYYNADGTSAKKWDYFNTNVTLYAEWGHLHNDSGEDVAFDPWTSTSSLPKSGNYFLMKDVTLNDKIVLEGNLNLDLNGHTVKFSSTKGGSAIDLGTNKNFYLYDCVGGGKLLRTGTGYDRCVWVSGGASFYMYGGTISGFKNSNSDGGAVCVNDGIMYMYGGEITDCQGRNGGAIYVNNNKKLYIYGGEIANCQATNDGGAVCVNNGVMYMYGGKIHDNTCGSPTGAGIFSGGGTVTVSGSGMLDSDSVGVSFTDPTGSSTVSFDQNGGVGGQTEIVTATWGKAMPSVSAVPTNGELEFLGYFDECGEQFYNGKGKSAKNWDYFGVDVTLYAKWKTPLKHEDFVAWTSTNSLPNKAGNYCLSGDVKLGGTWTVPSGEVNLCLHGHSITFTSTNVNPIVINVGSTLNIYDFSDTVIQGYLTPVSQSHDLSSTQISNSLWRNGAAPSGTTSVPLTGGYITFNIHTVSDGSGVIVKGALNMYGGNFAGCHKIPIASPDAGWGTVVNVNAGGSFNMYGDSSITGCVAEDDQNGGGHFRGLVCATSSTASMNDNARIQYCTSARINGSIRSVVVLNGDSTFTMNDNAKVDHCSGDGSGAFCLQGKNDALIMNDNSEISYGNGTWCAAVYLGSENSRLEMHNNASIHDCYTTRSDGRAPILMEGTNCALYMYDNTSITNNTGWAGGGNGYTIQLASNGNNGQKLYVNDSARITGNMVWNSAKTSKTVGNVYMHSGAQMIVLGTGEDAPKEGMNIGVTLESITGKFSTAADIDYSDYFQSDRAGYGVFRDSDKQLEIGITYKVHLNLNADDAVCDPLTSYPYGIGAKLPKPTRSKYVFRGWFDNEKFDGEEVTEIGKDATNEKKFYAKWQSVTDEHLESGKCDSNGGKGEIMGHQERSGNPEIGRVIIPLTDQQLKSIGDKLVIVGGDNDSQTTFEVDCAYTYFYNDGQKIEAGITKGLEDIAAFVIIENDGDPNNTISGYGYYRLYNNSSDNESNFMFDVMYKKPKN